MPLTGGKKRLLVVGAGGFGREVAAWASDIPLSARDWELGGFLDDCADALHGYEVGLPIVGGIAEYVPQESDLFVMALGDPRTKLAAAGRLTKRGAQFITLVHPTAIVGDRSRLGAGTVVCPRAVITTDVKIGRFVTINLHATIGHDTVVGDGCTLSCQTDVTGFARLGEGVFLGSHASVLPGAKVGDYAKVGAGSIVLKKVRPGTTVLGVPGKADIGGG